MAQVPNSTGEELLTIKQASRFLNVSEISLRRWTNSGRLACLRVGGKRERRFRRDDLLAFLETPGKLPPTTSTRAAPPAHIDVEGIAIDHGSHLCLVYENDLGRLKLAVPFLADGLGNGDACCLVSAPDAANDILHHLSAVCPQLDDRIAGGELLVIEGAATANAMFGKLEDFLNTAVRAGKRSIRVFGDMAWALHKEMKIDALMDFETRYEYALAHRFPVVAMCQYDARLFEGVGILRALKCHPDTFRYPLARFLN